MLVQATGAPAFSAASSGGSLVSQCTARKRRPVTFPAASETSHTSGGAMTSGWINSARLKPAWSEIIGVLVTPPGTRTLTVTDALEIRQARYRWFGDPRFTASGGGVILRSEEGL